ncbi:hypothetical protein ACROYT_G002405 [Oculina patagonica]
MGPSYFGVRNPLPRSNAGLESIHLDFLLVCRSNLFWFFSGRSVSRLLSISQALRKEKTNGSNIEDMSKPGDRRRP